MQSKLHCKGLEVDPSVFGNAGVFVNPEVSKNYQENNKLLKQTTKV